MGARGSSSDASPNLHSDFQPRNRNVIKWGGNTVSAESTLLGATFSHQRSLQGHGTCRFLSIVRLPLVGHINSAVSPDFPLKSVSSTYKP